MPANGTAMAPSGDRSQWLLPLRVVPAPSTRIILFPFAGGGPMAFQRWIPVLPAGVDLWAVQLPGRERRFAEAPCRRLATLVTAIAPRLEPLFDIPCALFGHSMGALVAFETVRALARSPGVRLPRLLGVGGCPPPSVPRTFSVRYDLPDDQFATGVRHLNQTRPDVLASDELLTLMLPTIRADFEVTQTYRYASAPPLPVPIVAIGGAGDPHVAVGSLDGWRRETASELFVHVAAGDHFFILQSPADVVSLLTRQLNRTHTA